MTTNQKAKHSNAKFEFMSSCRAMPLSAVIGALELPASVEAALSELGLATTTQLALADIDTILAQPACAQQHRVDRAHLERVRPRRRPIDRSIDLTHFLCSCFARRWS